MTTSNPSYMFLSKLTGNNNETIKANTKNTFTHWYLYGTNLNQKLDRYYNNQLKINENQTVQCTFH